MEEEQSGDIQQLARLPSAERTSELLNEYMRRCRQIRQRRLREDQLERGQLETRRLEREERRQELRLRRERRQLERGEVEIRHVDRRLVDVRRRVLMRQRDPVVRGLTPERIENFEHFDADESMVGERCIICMDDLEVGTKMVRLDCHVDHYLCQKCANSWFKDHKTCPTCRRVFS